MRLLQPLQYWLVDLIDPLLSHSFGASLVCLSLTIGLPSSATRTSSFCQVKLARRVFWSSKKWRPQVTELTQGIVWLAFSGFVKKCMCSSVWLKLAFIIICERGYGGETDVQILPNIAYHLYLTKVHNECAFQIVSFNLKLYGYKSIFLVN